MKIACVTTMATNGKKMSEDHKRCKYRTLPIIHRARELAKAAKTVKGRKFPLFCSIYRNIT